MFIFCCLLTVVFTIYCLLSFVTRDKEVIEAVAKKLGGFILQSRVTMATTHVVCGAPRRTLNALAGSVRGCWLVGPEWVSGCRMLHVVGCVDCGIPPLACICM